MKKAVKFGLAVLAVSAMSGASFAATTGSYLGLGLGASRLGTPNYIAPDATSTSKSVGGMGERIFAGYNFNQYLGVETGFARYAQSKFKASAPGAAAESLRHYLSALSVVGKAYLPVSDSGFNLYALGGAALVYSKFQDSSSGDVIPNFNGSKTTRKVRPTFGIGASYDVTSNVTTNVELSRIQGLGNMKTSEKAIPNADMMSFNVSYNFG